MLGTERQFAKKLLELTGSDLELLLLWFNLRFVQTYPFVLGMAMVLKRDCCKEWSLAIKTQPVSPMCFQKIIIFGSQEI